MLFKDCERTDGRTDRRTTTTTDGEWSQYLTLSLRLRWAKTQKKKKKKKETKNDRCFLLTIARSNGVTIKDLIRLKTSTLVSATVSSDTGQLGIDYLTLKVKSVYRRDTTPFSTGFYQILYWNTACAFAFSKNESWLQEAKRTYIRDFLWVHGTHRG